MAATVTIDGIKPAVRRRLVVPYTCHLGELHLPIQAAFDWWNCHLHEFQIGGLRYGDPDADGWGSLDDPRVFDEREVRLLDFDRDAGLTFTYLYDFGNDWYHTVTLERLLILGAWPRYAICLDGARARPPEDVGCYEHFLTAMADPDAPEHAEIRRWCGGHFDRDWFDRAVVDKELKSALKPNVRRRLHQPNPIRPERPS